MHFIYVPCLVAIQKTILCTSSALRYCFTSIVVLTIKSNPFIITRNCRRVRNKSHFPNGKFQKSKSEFYMYLNSSCIERVIGMHWRSGFFWTYFWRFPALFGCLFMRMHYLGVLSGSSAPPPPPEDNMPIRDSNMYVFLISQSVVIVILYHLHCHFFQVKSIKS